MVVIEEYSSVGEHIICMCENLGSVPSIKKTCLSRLWSYQQENMPSRVRSWKINMVKIGYCVYGKKIIKL